MSVSRALSVLVVDDYPDAADTLSALVELFGHRVAIAHDGEEAVRLAVESPPDVVLLDIGLPVVDGCAVAKKLLAVLPNRPLLVAVSGYTHLRELCLAAGIDQYFRKPLEAAVLEDLLRRHAEKVTAQIV